MPDKARLPRKQGRVIFCVVFALLSQPTYKLSKQLVPLHFDYFSCYQQGIKALIGSAQ